MAALAACSLTAPARGLAEKPPIPMALSIETLTNNDLKNARAAYRVWSDQMVSQLCPRCVDILPDIFYPSQQLQQMVRTGQVGCCVLTPREYTRVQEYLDPDPFMVVDYAANGLEDLILVHRSHPAQKLEDLKHSTLVLHEHIDTLLIRYWLAVELAMRHQPEMDQFFSAVVTYHKANEVLLPLFFRKVEAVGICRRSFNLARELNPQLGRDLRVLAVSPKLVTLGLWFRKGSDADLKRQIVSAMSRLDTTTAGKQMLTLYETGSFVQRPASLLNETLEMLKQFDRLKHG